jgi:hypothetical protein
LVLLCDIDTEEEKPYQRKDYYALHTIHLKKGQNIYLLSDGGNIEGFIVPLKDKTLFLTDRETTILAPTQYPSSYSDDFIDYEPEEHLILRPKGKRYELMNSYKEKVLSGRYDTIYYNKFGVIGRRGSKFTLYDSYLQKKSFKGMRSVYFYRNGIEMLNKQGAAYYTISGERIEKFPKISYSLCGTVYESRYSLKKDPEKSENPHYMVLEALLQISKPKNETIFLIEVPMKHFLSLMVVGILNGMRMTFLSITFTITQSLYVCNAETNTDCSNTIIKRFQKKNYILKE